MPSHSRLGAETLLGCLLLLAVNSLASACETPVLSQSEATVQKAYIAYYGRAADALGRRFWAGELDARAGRLDAIINAFGTSREFEQYYGNLSNGTLIDTIYRQLFNRLPDPGGRAFWLNYMNGGIATLQDITFYVLNGATGTDYNIIQNKLTAAAYITACIATRGYAYDASKMPGIKAIISDVTADAGSVVAARSALDALFSGSQTQVPAVPGGLSATGGVAASQIEVTWRPVANVEDYELNVMVHPDAQTGWGIDLADTRFVATEEFLADNPSPSNTWYFRVCACNAAGCSGYTEWVSASLGQVLPDLVVTAVSGPATAVLGAETDGFSATVENRGTARAESFRVNFLFSVNRTITLNDEDSGWGCNISGLDARATRGCSGPVAIPSGLSGGTYYVGAYADVNEAVAEASETNNSLAATRAIALEGGSSGTVVFDSATGLSWQREDDNTLRDQEDAILYCRNLRLDGYDDWELPELLELATIVRYDRVEPAIDEDRFPGTNSADYWTASDNPYDTWGSYRYGWALSFGRGSFSGLNAQVTARKYVRCVRGEPLAFAQFRDNRDGTVTDDATGLMWQQSDDGVRRGFGDAASYCRGLRLAGHTDWELPGVDELVTIFDWSGGSRMDARFFPDWAEPGFSHTIWWTSTEEAGLVGWVWALKAGRNLADSPETITTRSSERWWVRCVRDR